MSLDDKYLLTRQLLEAFDFDLFLTKSRSRRTVEQIFGNQPKTWTNDDFALVYYFLFQKWKPKRCAELFRGIWPSRDAKQEADFRKVVFDTLKKANDAGEVELGAVTMIHFQRRSGAGFHTITAKLAFHILSRGVEDLVPSESIEQLELRYMEQSEKLETFETELKRYEELVDKTIEARNKELLRLRTELESCSSTKVTVEDVNRLTEEINAMEVVIRKATVMMRDKELNAMRRGEGDHAAKLVANLPKWLRQLDDVAALVKANSANAVVDGVRKGKEFGRIVSANRTLFEGRGVACRAGLQAEVEALRAELLDTPRGQVVQARIRALFAPILGLTFDLPNSSPGQTCVVVESVEPRVQQSSRPPPPRKSIA